MLYILEKLLPLSVSFSPDVPLRVPVLLPSLIVSAASVSDRCHVVI